MQVWFITCKSINTIKHINKIKDKNHTIISYAEKSFDKIKHLPRSQWLTPIILDTQEAEVRRISVQSQPGHIVCKKILSQKNPPQKRAGGVAQSVSPEFKPQYHTKKKKKIKHLFMIKALKKLGIEGTYFNIAKATYNKPIVNIILSGKKTEIISSKARNEIMVSTLLTLTQYSTGIPSQINKAREINKRTQMEREEVKLSLLKIDMILYLKDPKDSTKILLDLINTFSNVAGYKINIQKSVAFLHTNNKQAEKNQESKSIHNIHKKISQ
jgi:hypothetical protein